MARAACGSLVALRPRLSPGLPFRAPSREGVRSCRTTCPNRQKTKADSFDRIGQLAGGPADVANAVVPWLCVTAFRRFCSEQRVVLLLSDPAQPRPAQAGRMPHTVLPQNIAVQVVGLPLAPCSDRSCQKRIRHRQGPRHYCLSRIVLRGRYAGAVSEHGSLLRPHPPSDRGTIATPLRGAQYGELLD